MYLSEEQSERTGGHLWTERVVETPMGKILLLLAAYRNIVFAPYKSI
jgi:hypothetical protein